MPDSYGIANIGSIAQEFTRGYAMGKQMNLQKQAREIDGINSRLQTIGHLMSQPGLRPEARDALATFYATTAAEVDNVGKGKKKGSGSSSGAGAKSGSKKSGGIMGVFSNLGKMFTGRADDDEESGPAENPFLAALQGGSRQPAAAAASGTGMPRGLNTPPSPAMAVGIPTKPYLDETTSFDPQGGRGTPEQSPERTHGDLGTAVATQYRSQAGSPGATVQPGQGAQSVPLPGQLRQDITSRLGGRYFSADKDTVNREMRVQAEGIIRTLQNDMDQYLSSTQGKDSWESAINDEHFRKAYRTLDEYDRALGTKTAEEYRSMRFSEYQPGYRMPEPTKPRNAQEQLGDKLATIATNGGPRTPEEVNTLQGWKSQLEAKAAAGRAPLDREDQLTKDAIDAMMVPPAQRTQAQQNTLRAFTQYKTATRPPSSTTNVNLGAPHAATDPTTGENVFMAYDRKSGQYIKLPFLPPRPDVKPPMKWANFAGKPDSFGMPTQEKIHVLDVNQVMLLHRDKSIDARTLGAWLQTDAFESDEEKARLQKYIEANTNPYAGRSATAPANAPGPTQPKRPF